MTSLTRRGFVLAGMGAALASAGAVRPAGASSLLDPLADPRPTSDPGTVRLKQISIFALDGPPDYPLSSRVTSMAWSPDGRRLVVLNLGGVLSVIDTDSWRLVARFRIMSVSASRAFGFSANGRELIASKWVEPESRENPPAFSVFEMDTGRVVRESQPFPILVPQVGDSPNDYRLRQLRPDQQLVVSPDGRFVFIAFGATVSGSVRVHGYVFDGDRGELVGSGESKSWFLPAISNDNRLAAANFSAPTMSAPDELVIHSLPALTKLLSIPAHITGIASLAWSPTGDRLATGAAYPRGSPQEDSVRVWDAATGVQLAGFNDEFDPIWGIAWHPNGTFFLTRASSGIPLTGSSRETRRQGSLVRLLPANGGAPLLQYRPLDRGEIDAACVCPRTGRLAWHERRRIRIHEIQGL